MTKKIVAFANRKGGSGKTTSAVNVAAFVARALPADKRVLLVDIDPQGNAAHALGVDAGGRCLSQLLADPPRGLRDVIIQAGDAYKNLYLIPSSDTLQRVSQGLQVRAMQEADFSVWLDCLNRALGEYLALFEYVFIDCPPTLGLLDDALYKFATDVIVPVKMAYLDTTGAAMHLQNMDAHKKKGSRAKLTAVLPTFFRAREVVQRETFKELTRVYGRLVSRPVPQMAAMEQSQAMGQRTIFDYAPTSEAAKSYQHLAERFVL